MGHSLGGAASLAAANGIRSLKAVATIGAPFDPAHSVLHYADKIGEVDANGEVEVTLGGRALTISRHFLEDLAETNPETYLPRLRKPLLLLHSPIDQTVGIDNAQNIFLTTRYPKSLVALDKADHLVTKQGAAARAADLIGAWAEQYIVPENLPEPVDAATAVAIPAMGSRMGVIVRSNEHTVTADRTKKDGGKGQGFTAEGLLMSALATATTQTLKAAGKEHKVDAKAVEAISVTVAQDSDSSFTRTISLPDSLSAAQRTALVDASMATPIDALLNATVTTTIVTNEAVSS